MQWSQIFIRFALSLTVSEISPFYIKIGILAVFSKFWTHDLEVLSPHYEKAPLFSIDNIAAKFEDCTPCSYRDMLRTKKNRKIGSFLKFQTHDLKVLSPYYEKALLLSIGNIAAKFEDATPCSYRDMLRTKKWDARPPPAATGNNNNPNACRLWVKMLFRFQKFPHPHPPPLQQTGFLDSTHAIAVRKFALAPKFNQFDLSWTSQSASESDSTSRCVSKEYFNKLFWKKLKYQLLVGAQMLKCSNFTFLDLSVRHEWSHKVAWK